MTSTHISRQKGGKVCNLYYGREYIRFYLRVRGLHMRMLPKNAADLELLETLLEYEADVHLEDKRGWNAMK